MVRARHVRVQTSAGASDVDSDDEVMLDELLRRGNVASADLRCIEVSGQLQTRVDPSQVACLGAVKSKGRKPKGNVHQPSELKRGHAVVTTWGSCILRARASGGWNCDFRDDHPGGWFVPHAEILSQVDACTLPARDVLLNKVVCAQAQ